MKLIYFLSMVPLLTAFTSSDSAEPFLLDSQNITRADRFKRDLPNEFSWKDKMSPVKNQGSLCGSCWAYATIGVMEAMARKQGKGDTDFSEQQLIDCLDEGCNGGLPQHAFGYIQDYGVVSESAYPVTGEQGKCKETNQMSKTKFAKMVFVATDESRMQHSIVDGGPLVVSFQIGNAIRNYNSGIITSDDCKTDSKDEWHAAVITGFGPGYWEIRNSWGADWGENGYFRVKRDINWCYIRDHPVAGWL